MLFSSARVRFACIGLLGLCLCGAVFAEGEDELAAGVGVAPGPSLIPTGVPNIEGLLFVGTSNNSNDPVGTANDVFTVDPVTDNANSILSGVQVWGATADPANNRVLFTRASGLEPPAGQIGGGDELFEVPFAGGVPVSLGRITTAAGGFRVDGLAISGGVLYGANAGGGVENGLYEINMVSLEATPVALYADSISGIDADPDTGIIYGVNDSTGTLVTISTTGFISALAPYPAGLADIDGIAVGGGFAYLVTDESGSIPVYDIAANAFLTPLTSPFTSADVFSGAALAGTAGGDGGGDGGDGGGDGGGVPATDHRGLIALVVVLLLGSLFYIRRRQSA